MSNAKHTPLRIEAGNFAAASGFPDHEIKIKENRKSSGPAWDVFVRAPGSNRGKCIGSLFHSKGA